MFDFPSILINDWFIAIASGFLVGSTHWLPLFIRWRKAKSIVPRHLIQHDFYPIVVKDGQPALDVTKFSEAVDYLLVQEDHLSAADLIYLGEANTIATELKPKQLKKYRKLLSKYKTVDLKKMTLEAREIFENYQRIVMGLGRSLPHIEFVLHNLRNPLKSIIAIENSVTAREVGGPATPYVIKLMYNYGCRLATGGDVFKPQGKIGYLKENAAGDPIKATTIPIYHATLGLIGTVCMNINRKFVQEKSTQEMFLNDLIRLHYHN